jgi:hypothetical protein
MPTRGLSDIEAIEAQPILGRALPESTFEALLASEGKINKLAAPLGVRTPPLTVDA